MWDSIINNKRSKKHDDERDVIKVDIPFEEWDKVDCVTIYIKGQRVVNNAFDELICEGKVYNDGVQSCEKDGIIQLLMKNVIE